MSRKKMNFTLPVELLERLKDVSEETLIPQARLIEKALVKVLDEHEKGAENEK